MENNGLLENEEVEFTEEIEVLPEGEGNEEISESTGQSNDEVIESVSDGDAILLLDMENYDEQFSEIIKELVQQREDIKGLQEFFEYETQSIFEKPLEDYTVTEGLMLIIVFVVVFAVLIKLIGGIITCRI